MQNVYTPNFKPVSADAKALVNHLIEQLDMRKAAFKAADPEELQVTVASFAVFGKHPFDVVINNIPKAKRNLVKAVFDALLGTYLKRVSGKNTVRFENKTNHHALKFQTVEQVQGIRVESKTGAVCLDDSYENFNFDLIGHVRHMPAELVTLLAPNAHLHILEGLAQGPSRKWFEMDELEEPFQTPEKTWDQVRDFLVEQVRLRGGYIAPFGESSFLCPSGDQALRQIDVAFLRLYGKRFQPLAKIRDRYGREVIRPGGWA